MVGTMRALRGWHKQGPAAQWVSLPPLSLLQLPTRTRGEGGVLGPRCLCIGKLPALCPVSLDAHNILGSGSGNAGDAGNTHQRMCLAKGKSEAETLCFLHPLLGSVLGGLQDTGSRRVAPGWVGSYINFTDTPCHSPPLTLAPTSRFCS